MKIITGGEAARPSASVLAALTRASHVVDATGSSRDALDFARLTACDAVVICPEFADGAMLCAISAFRTHSPQAAIVAILNIGESRDAEGLLDAGADDVLPFTGSATFLLARLTAAIRRAWGHAVSDIQVGALSLRLGQFECNVDGHIIALTRMEYHLLEALALRRGQLVARQTLLELLYCAGNEPLPKAIDLFAHNLRRKLAATGNAGYLETRGKAFVLRSGGAIAGEPELGSAA